MQRGGCKCFNQCAFEIKIKNHIIITISMTPGVCMTVVHRCMFSENLLPVEQSTSKLLISDHCLLSRYQYSVITQD